MPSKDLTPEQWEDLVDSGHSCDESCASGDHSRSWTETPDDDLITALALFEGGRAGRFGSIDPGYAPSILWRKARELLELGDARTDDAHALDAIAEKYRELLEQWVDELQTSDLLRRAQEETDRVVRQVERQRIAALKRSAPRPDRRSPNRPTRVMVDPEAWDVVKRQAILDRRLVAEVVGALIVEPAPTTSSHRSTHRESRFARLFVDDPHWIALRALAGDRGVTVAELVGRLVEREASRLGWTPKADR